MILVVPGILGGEHPWIHALLSSTVISKVFDVEPLEKKPERIGYSTVRLHLTSLWKTWPEKWGLEKVTCQICQVLNNASVWYPYFCLGYLPRSCPSEFHIASWRRKIYRLIPHAMFFFLGNSILHALSTNNRFVFFFGTNTPHCSNQHHRTLKGHEGLGASDDILPGLFPNSLLFQRANSISPESPPVKRSGQLHPPRFLASAKNPGHHWNLRFKTPILMKFGIVIKVMWKTYWIIQSNRSGSTSKWIQYPMRRITDWCTAGEWYLTVFLSSDPEKLVWNKHEMSSLCDFNMLVFHWWGQSGMSCEFPFG